MKKKEGKKAGQPIQQLKQDPTDNIISSSNDLKKKLIGKH